VSEALDTLMPDSGWVRRYVDLYTPMSEAPAEAHLATALAVLSAAVGWRAYIRWGESAEPCNLFVMLEGGSATAKKTTTARTGSGLVRHAMRAMPEGVDRPLMVRSVSHTSRRGLIELIGTADEAKAKIWESSPPPGILLDWDEFGAVLGKPGDVKGADWLGQVRATLMEIYGGRHGGIQTGEAKFKPTRCAVSVLATMTRQELEQRMSMGLLRDGFLGRFVMIPHPGRRTYLSEPPEWTKEDAHDRDRLADELREVASSHAVLGDIFGRMTGDAREFRRLWYVHRMEELDAAAETGDEVAVAMSDAMGRLQSTAAKVAAVLAVADRDPGQSLDALRVEWRHVERGIAFAEHALAEVQNLAGAGAGMPTDRYGRKVLDYLARRNGHGPATRSQLMDAVRMDGMDAAACWRVVERLHAEGKLTVTVVKTGGRPKHEVSLG
jgi:hypothetical protein